MVWNECIYFNAFMNIFSLNTIGINCDRECIHFANESKICRLNMIIYFLTKNIKQMFRIFVFTEKKNIIKSIHQINNLHK